MGSPAVLRTLLILVTASCCEADDVVEGVDDVDTRLPRGEPESGDFLLDWVNARLKVTARLQQMRHPNAAYLDSGDDSQPGFRMCHLLPGTCESYQQFNDWGRDSGEDTHISTEWRCNHLAVQPVAPTTVTNDNST